MAVTCWISPPSFLPKKASDDLSAAQHKRQAQESLLNEHQRRLACRLYVGSLHYDVKESDIRSIFSPFGPIAQIDVSFDQNTGKSKGYAFIEFAGTVPKDLIWFG